MVSKAVKTAEVTKNMVSIKAKQLSPTQMESIAIQKVVANFKKPPLYSFSKFLQDLLESVSKTFAKQREEFFHRQNINILSFMMDCETGEFRKWNSFRIELGNLKARQFKGRATPARKSKGAGSGEADRMGKMYDREKQGVGHFTTLPLWKCKTVKEKIKMIGDSDAPAHIKVEFIQDLVMPK